MIVPDNASPADLGDEPEGFWDVYRAQIDAWVYELRPVPDDESD